MVSLHEGDDAPGFSLKNQDGNEVSLIDYKGKWVVLYFYPKDNTPGCTLEAQSFSNLNNEFEQKNAVVLGVSPDSVQKHCNFVEKRNLSIDLLSDENKVVLNLYGVWDKKKFMGKEYMGVVRSTFLINPQKKIIKTWSPVRVKGHAQDVLNELVGRL